ncbi:MAG TPA: hypothetical protein VGF64_07715 [Acidimicrobiales bacterium]
MGDLMSPQWLNELEPRADLGLPLPRTRFRTLKRVVIRLCWVFLHRQVEYNHEVARSLERLAARLGAVADESAAWAKVAADLRVRVGQLHMEEAARHDEVLRVLRGELGELQQEVARASSVLSTEQVRAGVHEGQAAELARSLLEVEERLAGLADAVAHGGAEGHSVARDPRKSQSRP